MTLRRFVRRVPLVACVTLLVLTLAACGSAQRSDAPDQMHGGAVSSGEATPGIQGQEEPMHLSSVTVTGREVAVIETSKGTIRVEFFASDAPNTVASFIELADAGFYNGIKFHRVVPNFVVQAGDPETRELSGAEVREITARQAKGVVQSGEPYIGAGGPGWVMKAEINARKHLKGTVAMARSTALDSAGSQFYICLEPQPGLDGQYTVFGQVIEGMDVVESIEVGDAILSVTIER